MSSHAAVTWKVVEGLEGLSANRPRVWDATLQTLQTLHCPASGLRPMEGLEGLQVNRPHARSEKLQTFQTVHCIPWPVAYPVARMTAPVALLKPADREPLAARVRELAELAELMRQPGTLAEAPRAGPAAPRGPRDRHREDQAVMLTKTAERAVNSRIRTLRTERQNWLAWKYTQSGEPWRAGPAHVPPGPLLRGMRGGCFPANRTRLLGRFRSGVLLPRLSVKRAGGAERGSRRERKRRVHLGGSGPWDTNPRS